MKYLYRVTNELSREEVSNDEEYNTKQQNRVVRYTNNLLEAKKWFKMYVYKYQTKTMFEKLSSKTGKYSIIINSYSND